MPSVTVQTSRRVVWFKVDIIKSALNTPYTYVQLTIRKIQEYLYEYNMLKVTKDEKCSITTYILQLYTSVHLESKSLL